MTKLKGTSYCSKESVRFRTSSSSLASDASAELAAMEANQRAPLIGKQGLGTMPWGANAGGADVSGRGGHADSGVEAERGGPEEIEGQIAKIRAALTEFLEELGLKEGCEGGDVRLDPSVGAGAVLTRGAALVSELVTCVEEQGKLRVKLQQVRSGGGGGRPA